MLVEHRLDDVVVFEQRGIEDRMAPGDTIRFATLGEFGGGVDAGGVEQPTCRFVDDGRGYQELCGEAYDRVDDARLVQPRLRCNEASGPKREVPDEGGQPAQDHLLSLRKQ